MLFNRNNISIGSSLINITNLNAKNNPKMMIQSKNSHQHFLQNRKIFRVKKMHMSETIVK